MYDDQKRAEIMRAAGAVDYKSKGCGASELVSATRTAQTLGRALTG